MALANDYTLLFNKIERRLGLTQLMPHLPEELSKDVGWINTIKEDTLVTFSRYYPNVLKMIINDDTCNKKDENGTVWYYIKDEVLQGVRLLGVRDIDWMDNTTKNSSLGSTSLGGGYYYPNFACPAATFESVLALQMNADMSSLYNRGIYIDFQYPNRFSLKGLGNTNYDLDQFVIDLLVQHVSLNTISPTKMEIFERLATADIAKLLYGQLKYVDGLETAYVQLDLKIQDLQEEAQRREDIINELKESYVSTSNDNIPYIWSI